MSKEDSLTQWAQGEVERQRSTLNLIPSENYTYPEVLELLGSRLQDKYSEGYPGKRYYPGNEVVDEIEKRTQKAALEAFGLQGKDWHANVQPYSGSPANLAIYLALADPGEKIMGLKLASGGHLTHGHSVSATGKLWTPVRYDLAPESGRLDYDAILKIAREDRPKIIVSGFTAYPRHVNFQKFGEIAREVGAYHVADISHIAGLVAAGEHPRPFGHADVVMSTTHKTLRGPRGAVIFTKKELAQSIDKSVFPGLQGGPHDNVTVAKAFCFEKADTSEFKQYASQVVSNARALADTLIELGFNLISGGTDTHLLLMDVTNFDISGAEAEQKLEQVSILANRNTVPGDTNPKSPSGLRLGAPALTTRGMREEEMQAIARLLYDALTKKRSQENIAQEVRKLAENFPIPEQ